MSTEKMREEFEEWVRSEWPDTYLDRVPFGEGRKLEGCYCEVYVQMSWSVWQASRAAIEVPAPDDGIDDCQEQWGEQCKNTFDCGYNFASMRYDQAIESLGLKVKQ